MAFGPVSLRVVIRFQICIFDIAFNQEAFLAIVVIRFQICIFDILNTACIDEIPDIVEL